MRAPPWALACLPLLLIGCLDGLVGGVDRSTWAFEDTGLSALADRGLTGAGVRVAVIDTGIDLGHPVLDGVDLVAWRDVTDGRPEPYDPVGHGTHVAGVLAGGSPVRGAAPKVQLIVAKVFDSESRATDVTVADGIRFAIDQGAQVIGLSLGGESFPILGTASEDAVRQAVGRGILVVAAAGNEGPDNGDVSSPGNVAQAITVAALDRAGQVAGFSSRGAASGGGLLGIGARQAPDQKPEVGAPGVDIVGPYTKGRYVSASGTSQAVPFVVGALALLLEAHPGLRPTDADGVDEVKLWLMESAAEVPGAQQPHDRAAGYGALRADRLLDRASAAVGRAPLPVPPPVPLAA